MHDGQHAITARGAAVVNQTAAHPLQRPQRPVLKRGLSREESAAYVGVGATLFDRMVANGEMPQPVEMGGRVVWDIWELDQAFSALPRRPGPTQNKPPTGGWDD